jgi:CRP/FNR family transcriptional regulator
MWLPYPRREDALARQTHSLVKALRAVPDFASLDERTLLRILGASANLWWPAGSIVFRTDSPGEALFVILAGRVRIFEVVDGKEVEVAEYGPGHSFGELSLMLRTTHTKDAQAVQDTELLVIPADSFEQLLATNPDLDALFQRRLRERTAVKGDVPEAT